MKRYVWLPLGFLLALIPNLSFGHGYISVESEGHGVSQEDAVLAAKREALRKGIDTLLVSKTEVESFNLKRDMVLSATIEAVRSYELLARRQEGTIYFVKIRAKLSEIRMRQGLVAMKIFLESMDKPRMLVLIKEESGCSVKNALVEYFTDKGITVPSLEVKNDTLLSSAMGGDALAAAQLGVDNGADYVLVGKVKKGGMDSQLLEEAGMISGQASLTLRVINTENAAFIASKSESAGAAHVSAEIAQEVAALTVARKMVDQEFFEQIVGSYQQMINNGKPIEVTFRNVDDFQTQKAIHTYVTGLADVSLHNRSFSDDQLLLSVLYKGSVDAFCLRLDGKTVRGKKLAVMSIVGSRVVVVLQMPR